METFLTYNGYYLEQMPMGIGITILLTVILGYIGAPFILWAIGILGSMWLFAAPQEAMIAVGAVLLVFLVPPIRANTASRFVKWVFETLKFLPKISETERNALDAGVVWSESDLFSGKPNFKKIIHSQPSPKFTPEEQAFMDGPVTELCRMLDDWKIWKTRKLDDEVLSFIKNKGFLGMIIPKSYGGLGFSAHLHSSVIQMISSRSVTATITVMVPNSLGPAELLIHYGTDAQKDKHLPRLAKGQDLPCFGLTEPQAGSDAGSITSTGELFKGDDGRIKMKLNWNKRWITLAAISQTIGLAFKVKDPKNLLGKGVDLGITAALIPSSTKGVVLGKRHDPLGVPFYNCPTEGHDVVVDAEEAIIGGIVNVGKGWAMLMDCLAAGRGISLPSQSAGGTKLVARVASNHSLIRKQFGSAIGKFEGIEEPLARSAASAYWVEAMRLYTNSALDQGVKPPVVTAICKHYATEEFRFRINDGMDIIGGAGISLGPRNLLGVPYIAAPIGITVEGANILTRTLIIFGQGALRAHPYAYKEVKALEANDLKGFDSVFWAHIGHVVTNLFRSIVLSLTRGRLAIVPGSKGLRRYYQKLAWTSATFAIMTDLAMASLGGALKAKQKLTGRYADVLAWMYVATSVMHRYYHDGERKEDLPVVEYCLQMSFANIQKAFDGIFANFELPVVGILFKGPLAWYSGLNRIDNAPSDRLSKKLAKILLAPSELRDRLTDGIYLPKDAVDALGRQELAFKTIFAADSIDKKVRKAVRTKAIPKLKGLEAVKAALEKGIITSDEAKTLEMAEKMRWEAIQVDSFTEEEFIKWTETQSSILKDNPGAIRLA